MQLALSYLSAHLPRFPHLLQEQQLQRNDLSLNSYWGMMSLQLCLAQKVKLHPNICSQGCSPTYPSPPLHHTGSNRSLALYQQVLFPSLPVNHQPTLFAAVLFTKVKIKPTIWAHSEVVCPCYWLNCLCFIGIYCIFYILIHVRMCACIAWTW